MCPSSGHQAGLPTPAPPLGPSAGLGTGSGVRASAPCLAQWAISPLPGPAPSSTAGPGPPPGDAPVGGRRERRQERGRSQERRQPSSSSSEKQRFYSCDRFGGREPLQHRPSLSSHPTSPTAGPEPGPPRQVCPGSRGCFSPQHLAWCPFSPCSQVQVRAPPHLTSSPLAFLLLPTRPGQTGLCPLPAPAIPQPATGA